MFLPVTLLLLLVSLHGGMALKCFCDTAEGCDMDGFCDTNDLMMSPSYLNTMQLIGSDSHIPICAITTAHGIEGISKHYCDMQEKQDLVVCNRMDSMMPNLRDGRVYRQLKNSFNYYCISDFCNSGTVLEHCEANLRENNLI